MDHQRWVANILLRRRRRQRRRQSPSEVRDWAELPRDVLSLVFRKLGGINVLWPAQAVCRSWRRLSLDPHIWRCIDMSGRLDLYKKVDVCAIARVAVDRSPGVVEEFHAEYFGDDGLLNYIADRTTGLRRIVLVLSYRISDKGLVDFVARCPLLEELQITNCSFLTETYGTVGRARPELKCFRLNKVWCDIPRLDTDLDFDDLNDREAIEIAENMPQLRELQLVGNQITNKGLHAILDNCSQLVSLDIRVCLNVDVDDGLRAKLARIENVKLPRDSTADYGFMTGLEEELNVVDYSSLGYTGEADYPINYDDLFVSDSDTSCDDDDFTVQDYYDLLDDCGFPQI